MLSPHLLDDRARLRGERAALHHAHHPQRRPRQRQRHRRRRRSLGLRTGCYQCQPTVEHTRRNRRGDFTSECADSGLRADRGRTATTVATPSFSIPPLTTAVAATTFATSPVAPSSCTSSSVAATVAAAALLPPCLRDCNDRAARPHNRFRVALVGLARNLAAVGLVLPKTPSDRAAAQGADGAVHGAGDGGGGMATSEGALHAGKAETAACAFRSDGARGEGRAHGVGRNHLAEARAHNRDPTSQTLEGSGGRECQNELPRGVAPSRARAPVARGAKAASAARRVSLPPRSRSLAEDEPPQSTAAAPRHPLASAGGCGARRTTNLARGCTTA
jgi:hypothetical protein